MKILHKNKSVVIHETASKVGFVSLQTNKYTTEVLFSRFYKAITNLCQEVEGERAKKKRK